MPSQLVFDLAALVRQEEDALARNDWEGFRQAHHEANALLDRFVPQEDDVPSLQSLLGELDLIQGQLATKHRITGTLLRNLGSWTRRTGRVISDRY